VNRRLEGLTGGASRPDHELPAMPQPLRRGQFVSTPAFAAESPTNSLSATVVCTFV
jgi:hypothetical protein